MIQLAEWIAKGSPPRMHIATRGMPHRETDAISVKREVALPGLLT